MKGTYKATVQDHTLSNIGVNLTPAVVFKLLLTHNILTGEDIEPVELYWNGWLTDKAVDGTLKTLDKAIGWQGTDINDFNGTNKFNGVEVSVVVDEEEYKGDVHTKVKFVNNINSTAKLTPADSGVARSLAEQIKGKVLAYRQKQASTKSAPVKNNPAADFKGDDDCPF